MKFFDKLMDRWRGKVEAEKEEVKRNTVRVEREVGFLSSLGLGGGYRRSREEMEFDNRAVVGAKLSRRLPMGTTLFRCRQGFYLKRYGHTPYSGPCPTQRTAEKAALRNLGI